MGSRQTTLRNRYFLQDCTHINPAPEMQWIPQNLPDETGNQENEPDETDNQGEQQTLVENHKRVSPNIIEGKPLVPNATPSTDPQSSLIPIKRTIPHALKNLQSFNYPGLKE